MASTDARPVPIKNTAFRAVFPLYDADGDLVTGATSLDSEISKDQGTYADCTNEATEIATSSGTYYLDLTSTEMNADCVSVIVKSGNAKTTVLVFYPQESGDIKVDVQSNAGTAITAASGRQEVNVSHFGGTAGTFASGRPEVNASHWNGTAVATPDSAGHPKVTIKTGTAAGELSISSGVASANAVQINSVAASAVRLALAAGQMIPGTVDNTVAPTTTQFECDDITEATADHYKDRIWLWTTGALAGQQTLIQAYSLVSGRGRFTVVAMTEAPANNDTGLIV